MWVEDFTAAELATLVEAVPADTYPAPRIVNPIELRVQEGTSGPLSCWDVGGGTFRLGRGFIVQNHIPNGITNLEGSIYEER